MNRNSRTGRYVHGLDSVCVCGRRLGEHDAEAPYALDPSCDGFSPRPRGTDGGLRGALARGVRATLVLAAVVGADPAEIPALGQLAAAARAVDVEAVARIDSNLRYYLGTVSLRRRVAVAEVG